MIMKMRIFHQSYNIKHSKQFSHIDWLHLQENDIYKFDFNKINSLREKWEHCDKNLIRKKKDEIIYNLFTDNVFIMKKIFLVFKKSKD